MTDYFLPVREAGTYTELLNTDASTFGGRGHCNPDAETRFEHGRNGIRIDLPAFSGIVFVKKQQ
jgi:1,4-alpha-glucan branching enzyme